MMTGYVALLWLAVSVLHAIEISIEDAGTDIEAINLNLLYTWLVHDDVESMQRLFATDLTVIINQETDYSIRILSKWKDGMHILDGDLITDTIDISYDNEDEEPVLILESGHYLFYNQKNMIVDAGTYETKWKWNDAAPKYVIKSMSLQTMVTNQNRNSLYLDEHDMGVLWATFWDRIGNLDDQNDEDAIHNFMNQFSVNFEFTFVDTKDIERMLFGRKQFVEWMNHYNGKGLYGADRLVVPKANDITMFKVSPWQSVLETNIILMDRKTKETLKEERWYIIMGYDVLHRTFYRASQFYDKTLFYGEIAQIEKRFPFARDKLPKDEL